MTNHLKQQLKLYQRNSRDRVYDLTQYTRARIGLGHTGGHLRIKNWLNFLTHFSQAKDAVYSRFDIEMITAMIDSLNLKSIQIQSRANDHTQFLLRPDLGELLAVDSETNLKQYATQYPSDCNKDLLIILSGGLSPIALQKQIPQFLPAFIQKIQQEAWSMAPILINPKGRVALSDHANFYFKAKVVIMLIGERPGLSSADSMGIYITYNAKPGCTNDQRNCISNIHEHGLSHNEAALKLIDLVKKAITMKLTGIELKDDLLVSSRLS